MAGVDILNPFPRQTHVPRPIRQPKLTAHLCKTTRAWEDTTGGPSPACLTSAWIRAVHRMAGVAGSAGCSPEGAVAKSPRPGEEAELPCASLSSPCTCRLPNQLPSVTCMGCDALPWPGCQGSASQVSGHTSAQDADAECGVQRWVLQLQRAQPVAENVCLAQPARQATSMGTAAQLH